MASLSIGMIGLRTVCQIMHTKNLKIVKSHTVKLLFLVVIIHILFISTYTVAGLTLTNNGSTDFAYFGDTINYDYKLVNDNGVDLHDVVFYDDHFGSIAIGNLNNGATWYSFPPSYNQ